MLNSARTMTPEEAMRQATMTAEHYMLVAKRAIERLFGPEILERSPELLGRLVAAFMQAAAADFDTWVRAQGIAADD